MSAINIPNALLKQARKSGNLNLSGRGLINVPDIVWNLNNSKNHDDVSFDAEDHWWEYIELTKLNLASNEISSLSEKLMNFPKLILLDLHDNKLHILPKAFSNLEKLKKVDISHNVLESLPRFHSSCTITILYLQHNHLKIFPFTVDGMLSCEQLDLSHNSLNEITQLIDDLVNLRSLNLSSNQLHSFPFLNNLKHLTVLNLNNNKLSSLPECFESFVCLKQLHLRSNVLTKLPNLQKCFKLLELYAGNNSLSIFAEYLPDCIVILELRDNKVNEIPENITNFQKLERFDIANNNISKLPPEIGNMASVKVLVLDGNPLRSIRQDIISRGTQAILKHLKSRIIQSSGDANIVTKGFVLPQSEQSMEIQKKHALSTTNKLTLNKENISFVYSSLEEAGSIELLEVSLTKCSLVAIPEKLVLQKNSLTTLNLSSNKLAEVASFIGLFTSLIHIDLSNNNLADLPSQFENLHSLRYINISSNKFVHIPVSLYHLYQLEHLIADSNLISSIDASMLNNLTQLNTLSLQNNNIGQVPPEIVLLNRLQTLKLEGNTFRVPRQSIVQKGSAAVIEYLRSRLPR